MKKPVVKLCFSLCVVMLVVALLMLQTAVAETKLIQRLNSDDGLLKVLSDDAKTKWQPVEEVEAEVGRESTLRFNFYN